jgi:hypothetical protein
VHSLEFRVRAGFSEQAAWDFARLMGVRPGPEWTEQFLSGFSL